MECLIKNEAKRQTELAKHTKLGSFLDQQYLPWLTTRNAKMSNKIAKSALINWLNDTNNQGYVFKGVDEQPIKDIKKAWSNLLKAAKITDFRLHDLRHHFASKLVMVGVDLNTVRELMGHSNLKMTLRYAHLAPEHKAAAVNLIC